MESSDDDNDGVGTGSGVSSGGEYRQQVCPTSTLILMQYMVLVVAESV